MTDVTQLQSSVLIPATEWGREAFQKALAKLNAKASKYGLPSIEAAEPVRERFARRYGHDRDGNIDHSYVVPLHDKPAGRGDEILHFDRIALTYPIIALGPWKVLGKVETLGKTRFVFAATHDEGELAQLGAYRETDSCCEHCNTKRQRKETFVVRHEETGETKQIGSACLEDFTGIDPSKVLFLAQTVTSLKGIEDDADHFMRGVGSDHWIRPVDYLQDVLFVREWQGGFVSATRAKEEMVEPTYRIAKNLAREMSGSARLRERWVGSRDRLLAQAQDMIDWWTAHAPSSEFERTVKDAMTAEEIPSASRFLAVMAASVSALERAKAKQLEREAAPSEHVGQQGDKLQQPMRLTGLYPFESDFGTQFFCKFCDATGNKYSWKTANPPDALREAEAGMKWFDGKFKIKGHEEYRGDKITKITHVKVVNWIPAPALSSATIGTATSKGDPLVVVDVLTITSAFDDLGWRQQMEMVLTEAAAQLRDPERDVFAPITLKDVNGNAIGTVTFPTERPGKPDDDRMQVVMEPGTRESWAGLMERAALHVLGAETLGDLYVSHEGKRRSVASVQWNGLLAREAEVGNADDRALRGDHESVMP